MHATSVRAFVFLVLMLGHYCSSAQNSNYIVTSKQYTYKNGLSHNHVYQPFIDSRGIVWLVRDGGLDRFDGVHFKHLDFPEMKEGIKTLILLEDDDHYLWVKNWIDGSFCLFNILTEQLCTLQERFGAKFPTDITWVIRSNANGILACTARGSVIRYPVKGPPELVYGANGEDTMPIADNSDGSVWIRSNRFGQGQVFLNGADHQKKLIFPCKSGPILCTVLLNTDTVCFTTSDSIYKVNRQGQVLKKAFKDIIPADALKSNGSIGEFSKIQYDKSKGLIWIYYPHELVILDNSFNFIYKTNQLENRLVSNHVFEFKISNQGFVWLGTMQGLFQLNFTYNPFQQYLPAEPDDKGQLEESKSFRTIIQTPDSQVYALSSPYIYRLLPKGAVQEIVRNPKTGPGLMNIMDTDSAGNLWYLSRNLFHYDFRTKKERFFDYFTLTPWCLKVIDNQVWIGNPLACFDIASNDIRRIESYNGFDEFNEAYVYEFRVKSKQELWLISSNGVYVLDKEKGLTAHYWTKGTGQFYLPKDDLRACYEDTDGSWWLANTEGLLHWNRTTGAAHLYGKEAGVSNFCHAVLPDEYGNLWISSDLGLMQFDKHTGKARSFFSTDGLTSDEFNRQSYLKANNGILYFGGLNGVVSFDPKAFKQKHDKLSFVNLVLTECSIFSEKTNQEEDIRIKTLNTNLVDIFPGDRFLKVKVALTDYSDPTRITYRYRIKGYDDQWHDSSENELLISGLPFGNFVLEMDAIAPSGLKANQFLQISIRVHRPFYQQGWFLMLAILVLFGVFFYYVRWRTKILQSRAAMLEVAVQERTHVIENQQQRLKTLYDLKSRLYANITHEFRTPLTMIIGPASRVLPKARNLEQPEIADTLQQILAHGEQMLGLVNQMLDLHKLEAHAMTPLYARKDFVAFVAQIVSLFQSNAQHKQVDLTFQPESAEFQMDFDPENTEKILNNLLSNALKFTQKGGKVHVLLSVQKDWLQVVVSDSGRGVEPEHLPYIFERYYQVENESTRHYEGTGIGLALVKEMTELLEGTIHASSKLGVGSRFTLRLPVREQALGEMIQPKPYPIPFIEPALQSMEQELSATTSKLPRVLIIEDTPAVARFAASCLQDHYAVSTALSSKLGLKLAQKNIPDLVLCDIMMPEMDGYAVCQALKTDEKTSHIPVVFLTALEEQTNRLKRIEAGADAFLSKPFKQEELLGLLHSMLTQQKRLQQKYLQASAGSSVEQALENEPVMNPKDLQLLLRLRALIHENLDNPQLDVHLLCKKMGMSQSQLHRKLFALTGMSIGRYINHLRLQEARQMLDRSDFTIAEIAFQTGFSDPAYFTRLFAKTYGYSPRAYRSEQ